MRIKIEKPGEFGLVTDPSPQEIPHNAWSAVQNVRFDLSAARNANGYAELDTPTDPATYLVGFDVEGSWYIVYPGTDAIYSWSAGVETDISRATAYTGLHRWNGCVLSGVVILNNYGDCPQYWGGTGDCVDLIYSGTNTWDDYDGADGEYRAKVIRSYRNFLFALGIQEGGTEYPYMVHWSNPADPGTIPDSWDYADPTTLSGRVDLADTAGYVVDAVPLKDVLVIYKEDSVWLASYIGGQYQFRFDKLGEAQGLGIYSTDCAVDIGGRHVVMGDGVVYMHDGNSVQNILKGRAAEALFANIDPEYYDLTFLMHCPCSTEVFIVYPPVGSSSCTRAYVYNYAENTWSWREFPSSNFAVAQVVSDASTPSWPLSTDTTSWSSDPLASWDNRGYSPISDTIVAAGAKLWKFADIATYDGVNPVVMLERTGLRFGQGGQVALIRAVYPRIIGGPVDVQVGSQMTLAGDITWEEAQSFDPDEDTKIDCTVAGALHAIRFKTDGGESWRLNGYELDIESIGEY